MTTPLEPEVEKEAVCRKGRRDDNLSFDANPRPKNFRKNVYVSESRLGRWLIDLVRRYGGHERKMSHSLAARRQKDRGESQRLRFLALRPR